jgi:replicative DNA helicase
MPVHAYHLEAEFTDRAAEEALLASIAQHPPVYFELVGQLSPDIFTHHADVWRQLALAIEAERQPIIPEGWPPAADLHAMASRLVDLHQRRLLAAAQERLAQALFDETVPAPAVATLLEEEARRAQAVIRGSHADALQWADTLVPQVLATAEARRRQREQTGQPVMGLPTGLRRVDALLNGLDGGLLYILGGPPGAGKTTCALQIAGHVAGTVPVIYVTFENSRENLIIKAISALAEANAKDVQRGFADLERLRKAADRWQPSAHRVALVEGSSRLTVAQVRAYTRHAMQRHQAPQCLVIVDYLQLWAKVAESTRAAQPVRERVELLGWALRELAQDLRSPVLALSSQNRAQGDYGRGKGSAALDSLKESGDIEYAADVVLFLTQAPEGKATPPAVALELTVAKHRHGETGKVGLIFRPDIGVLREEARS